MQQRGRKRTAGMPALTFITLGQILSVTGTGMTSFALSLWAWQTTGSATALSLLMFFALGPGILLGPLAGTIVDRWSRKRVIILADVGAGLSTAAVLLLYATGHLQIWHLYVANVFAGVFQALQMPAVAASVTLMVPKEQYGRANGLLSLIHYAPEIGAPLLAGLLVPAVGIGPIMAIDLATFAVAMGATLLVFIPQPALSRAGQAARRSLWSELTFGFRYILDRPGLLGIQSVFLLFNLAGIFQWALQSPMILARTGQDARVLGIVLSAAGIGGVAGGLAMSAWGGPRRRIHGVLGGMAVQAVLGILLMGLGRSLPVWAAAAFVVLFCAPIINGSNQAIWQAKVAPDVQGRVFSARRMIAQLSYAVGLPLAGLLADRVFEPGLRAEGGPADALGALVGSGPGAGMALLMVVAGLFGAACALAGYLFPAIRRVETDVPDHDQPPAVPGQPTALAAGAEPA